MNDSEVKPHLQTDSSIAHNNKNFGRERKKERERKRERKREKSRTLER